MATTLVNDKTNFVRMSGWQICLASAVLGLFVFGASFAFETGDGTNTGQAFTMSEVNKILQDIALEVVLQAGESQNTSELLNASYLIPLASFLDLNIIGKGNHVILDKGKIVEFIVEALKKDSSTRHLGTALIEAFKKNHFSPQPPDQLEKAPLQEKLTTQVGGYLVGEFEFHQEPDGEYFPLLEVNQFRLYFSAQLSPAVGKNRVSVFAEMNPVPEEVIHQIESAPLASIGINDTLRSIESEPEEEIEFEQLYARIDNIDGSGFGIMIGQIRNPFGLWSDFTSHRNFTSTKNNTLVNGFALKKIELGIQVEKNFESGVVIKAALVHGRIGRTSSLDRADNDKSKDFVARLGYTGPKLGLGASAYLAEFSLNKRYAYGVDWQFLTPRFSLSGEAVFQKNSNPRSVLQGSLSQRIAGMRSLSSLGAYVQFSYSLGNRLSLYGLYETWRLYASAELVEDATYKIFHGFRHQINQRARWMIVEFGWMFHNNFDEGNLHLSTQLEVTF